MKLNNWLIAIFIFILAFIPRLYQIDNPVADWHSWRQADTAAVTRNFIKEGFTPFFPKFDSLNSLNGYADKNPNRYFFAEFPIYNILTYPFYLLFGINTIYARLVSIVFSALGAVGLFLLVKHYSSKRVAILSGIFYAILPYNIYYGRVIMPDPMHVTLGIYALYFLTLWLENKNHKSVLSWVQITLAGLSLSGNLLTKPYGLVLGLPIAYLILRKFGFSFLKKSQFYFYLILSLLPFLLWRWHISHHPEGQFGTDWLFNAGNIRFTGAFFRWLIYDRMNRLIFATGGFVLFFMGLIRGRTKKEGWFYYWWLVGILVFFTVIAKGNVTHDYYQMPLVPIGVIFIAKGFEFLMMYGRGIKQRIVNFTIAISLVLLMEAFGWYEVRGYFNINHWEIVRAGRAVDQLLPKDAKVIAPYSKDSAFLYQTNRYGWTAGGSEIKKFINEGADYLVSVNYDDSTNYWRDRCNVVTENPDFIIIDLKHCDKQEFSPSNPPTIDDVKL